ncbi:hypothetical protein [Halobacillus karajensis]|uniref:Uncharacterized protein n=1 Tax=Halobacillus karajensis TaxID=195088 RepID=A0A059NZ31_9BACI|nr:hypothetical protein [Halobacillus karajensis]CDQ20341.1 hypothetical protein BN982_02675 [Halobacillus karajensis]CDQ23591.1 hypothetical protein BN983_01833 [Halobacillus karajensis]CDQ27073.1 hypothetical protein BN981_01320 [Halobacillus karajensis]
MVIKVVLLTLLLFQVIYLLIRVKNGKEKKYYIPALFVSVITAWMIYKTLTMSGFAAINSTIFSAFGLFILFIFTKHPPFLKERN